MKLHGVIVFGMKSGVKKETNIKKNMKQNLHKFTARNIRETGSKILTMGCLANVKKKVQYGLLG